MKITKEMIEQQASKTELYEDGYKGFISGAEWVLSLIEANETNTVLAVSGHSLCDFIEGQKCDCKIGEHCKGIQ